MSAALGLVLAVLGGLELQVVRRLNARAIQRRAAALAAGESRAIRRLQYGGLLRDALRGALLTAPRALLAAWIIDARVRLDGSTAARPHAGRRGLRPGAAAGGALRSAGRGRAAPVAARPARWSGLVLAVLA